MASPTSGIKEIEKRYFKLEFIALLVLLLPTAYYFITFGKNGRSKDQEEWANFASFISAFASISSLLIVYIISRQANKIAERSHEENRLYQQENSILQDANERPILYLNLHFAEGQDHWKISNVGRGPALNVKLHITFSKFMGIEIKAQQLIRCYAIPGSHGNLVVECNRYGIQRFVMVYEDVRRRKYLSIADNHNTIVERMDDSFEGVTLDNGTVFTKDDLSEILKFPETNLSTFGNSYFINFYSV
jgi:hypothetical protein